MGRFGPNSGNIIFVDTVHLPGFLILTTAQHIWNSSLLPKFCFCGQKGSVAFPAVSSGLWTVARSGKKSPSSPIRESLVKLLNSTGFLDFHCLEQWTENTSVLLGHNTTSLALQFRMKTPFHREAWSRGAELQSVVKHRKQSLPGPISRCKRSVKDVVIPDLERIISWKGGGGG